jgi:hypothetical protein
MQIKIKNILEQQACSPIVVSNFWRFLTIKYGVDSSKSFVEHPWHSTDIFSLVK